MIVISGRYEQPGWSRLEHAEAEAAALVERYHAIGVDAVTDKVVGCLLGNPAGQRAAFLAARQVRPRFRQARVWCWSTAM